MSTVRSVFAGAESPYPCPCAPASSLVLVREAQIVVVEGRTFDLTRRPTLFRLLVGLVGALRPLSVMELFEVTWPGERIRASAARNRVHVGLSALRRLGLGPLLVRDHGRYSLATRCSQGGSTAASVEPREDPVQRPGGAGRGVRRPCAGPAVQRRRSDEHTRWTASSRGASAGVSVTTHTTTPLPPGAAR